MLLKKLSQDHYVVVTDEPIIEKSGEWFYSFETGKIYDTLIHHTAVSCKKITHSTQPIEPPCEHCSGDGIYIDGDNNRLNCPMCNGNGYVFIEPLSLSYVKSLFGEVDVEKKSIDYANKFIGEEPTADIDFKAGYLECQKDNRHKRFSEDDMWEIFVRGMGAVKSEELGLISAKDIFDRHIHSLTKPKDTWECYFDENGNLKLK